MTFTPNANPRLGEQVMLSPAPAQAPYSLLSVIEGLPLVPGTNLGQDGLPTARVRLPHQRCVQTITAANCPPEDADPFERQAADLGYPFFPVTWVVGVGCQEAPAGSSTFEQWRAWAEEDVIAATPHALESFLWHKASLESVQGVGTVMPSLAAVAQTVGDDSEMINPRDGVAQLIAAWNDCNEAGGKGILHIPDILGPYLADRKTIAPEGPVMKTATGVRAVLGTGYNERVGPYNNTADPTLDEEGAAWIYMSGQIYANLGKPRVTADPTGAIRESGRVPEGYAEPRLGDQGVWVARRGMFAMDTCCVLGIRVRIVNVEGELG